jgi:hypothetical protein
MYRWRRLLDHTQSRNPKQHAASGYYHRYSAYQWHLDSDHRSLTSHGVCLPGGEETTIMTDDNWSDHTRCQILPL